jgi:hypothetical protein
MDDGSKYKNKGRKFCTNSFTLDEVEILKSKYSLEATIPKTGVINQYKTMRYKILDN